MINCFAKLNFEMRKILITDIKMLIFNKSDRGFKK